MLPLSRNNTYVNGISEVDAEDINDLQDAVVQGAHGLISRWAPITARLDSDNNSHWSLSAFNSGGYISAVQGPGYISTWLPVHVGERLTDVHFYLLNGQVGQTMVCEARTIQGLIAGALPGPPFVHASSNVTDGPNLQIASLSVPPSLLDTAAVDAAHSVRVTTQAALTGVDECRIYGIRYDCVRDYD